MRREFWILLVIGGFALMGALAMGENLSQTDQNSVELSPRAVSDYSERNGDGQSGRGRFHERRDPVLRNTIDLVSRGREVFRHDTFGDEVFWGDTLRLHEGIATVSPEVALAVGLKVDVEALPRPLRQALRNGTVDLQDPVVTQALLRLNAVVGVTGFFDEQDQLNSVGIQCSLCHSIVDDSFAPGIGRRLDGWANRDLDVGTIISLSPDLQPLADLLGVSEPVVREVLASWGPGKFDASLLLDGRALRDDGRPAAVLIPPVFGLGGVNLTTWTGWGGISHWNALVATLEMGGQGTLLDARLNDASQFPIAAQNGFGETRNVPDLVTSKLPALQLYQLALPVPEPPEGSFDRAAASRGEELFQTKAECSSCHVPPLFTEPGYNLHAPEEIGVDDFQASRSPARGYRTSPLKGLWTHEKGGFFHDGRFPNLDAVINHYNTTFTLGLTNEEKSDLIEYLRSL